MMTNRMKFASILWLSAISLQAAVDGVVMNRTTGKPQPGAAVNLLSMGGGTISIKGSTTSDGSGHFRIDQTVDGPHLLQAVHQAVNYNSMLQAGTPTSRLTIDVYDTSDQPGLAKVLRHAVLLEPAGGDLSVRENILLRNGGKVTLKGQKEGTFRFYVPDSAAGSLRVSSRSLNSAALEQTPAKTAEPGVYRLDIPVKPGDTQLDWAYTLPFKNPGQFVSRTLQTDVPVRLVVPPGVIVEGGGLELVGKEQRSGAANYIVDTPAYSVTVRLPEATPEPTAPTQVLPRVYDNLLPILALAFAALAAGFIRLYRMRVPVASAARVRQSQPHPESRKRSRLTASRA